jgi:peptidoglycan-associated lipoprotein
MDRYRNMASVLLAVIALGAAGCASKTATEQDFGARPDDRSAATTTDVSQQPKPLGVESQPVQSGPVADHQSVAGLQLVHFDYNQFTLDEPARATLEQNAAYLRKNSGLRVAIEGHCDERGSDEFNLALGERRAMTARNYLVSLGIAAERLSVISYGEEQPLVAAANEEGWAKNRRAEFKVAR